MTLIAFKHWSITAGSARCENLFSAEVGKINYFGSRFLMWAVIDLLIKHVRPNQFDGMSRHRDQLAFIRSSVEKSGVKDSVAHWKNHKIRLGTKQINNESWPTDPYIRVGALKQTLLHQNTNNSSEICVDCPQKVPRNDDLQNVMQISELQSFYLVSTA